jgi:hypothetical protein
MQNVHEIKLNDGSRALVDLADRELVAGFVWHRGSGGYVYADRGRMRLGLHRLIAGAGDGDRVDHRNGNSLDNRSCNLRFADAAQNRANAGPNRIKAGKTSRFKGVSWASTKNRWLANIHIDGRTRYLGRYQDETEAARAYNAAALKAWGDFARLNDV